MFAFYISLALPAAAARSTNTYNDDTHLSQSLAVYTPTLLHSAHTDTQEIHKKYTGTQAHRHTDTTRNKGTVTSRASPIINPHTNATHNAYA